MPRRLRLSHAILIVYWLGLFVVTHVPPSRVPKTRVSDKVQHFASYALLSGLTLWSLRQTELSPRAAAWWTVIVCLTYGVIDELLQIPVGRVCSLGDWFADAAGVVTVVAVAVVVGAVRQVRAA
jgi:VanZ family protein